MLCVPWLQENVTSNSQTLLGFCCKAQFVNFQRHTDDYGSYIIHHSQYRFEVQHYRGSTLMAAFIHRCRQCSRHWGGMLPRFHRCLRGWKVLTPGYTRQPVYHRPRQSLVHGPSSLRLEKMDNTRKRIFQISPSSWIGNGATGSRRSCLRAHGRQGGPRVSVFPPPAPDQKRYSLSNSGFWPQHRSSSERRAPQRMQVSRVVAQGPERPAAREKRSSGSRLFVGASSNTLIDRNLRTTCRRSHPWNQLGFCLHRRLRRQYIMHLLVTTMSWPAAFEVMEFLVVQCVRIRRG